MLFFLHLGHGYAFCLDNSNTSSTQFPNPLALSETAILSKWWGGCAAARCVVAVLGALGIGIPHLHFRYETITLEVED